MGVMSTFFGAGKALEQEAATAQQASAMPSLDALKAAERNFANMRLAAVDEHRRAISLSREIDRLASVRVSEITLARIHGVEANVDEITAQIEQIKTQIKDAGDVEREIAAMCALYSGEMQTLRYAARQEVGRLLEQRFSSAAEAYNKHVSAVTPAVLELFALMRLMVKLGAGNSNGFSGVVALPRVQPGCGRTLEPLLWSGDIEFRGRVEARMNELAEELGLVDLTL